MKLLFVCSGNICRSPMAEGIARRLADDLRLDVTAASAGTLGIVDRPADPKAVRVCHEVGIDLSAHRSQPLSEELVRDADALFVMEPAHAAELYRRFPWLPEHAVVRTGELIGLPEIGDPIGRWTMTFRKVRKQLEQAVGMWLVQHAPPREP